MTRLSAAHAAHALCRALLLVGLAALGACNASSSGGGGGGGSGGGSGGGTGGDGDPVAACVDGAVTARCTCGTGVVSNGFCCSGVPRTSGCNQEPYDPIEQADYYVSPSGSDDAAGDIDHPFRTVKKAHAVAVAGDLVYFRGGTYPPPDPTRSETRLSGRNGTASAKIRFFAYPGERVIFDYSTMSSTSTGSMIGIDFTGDHWHWRGIEIAEAPQRPGQAMAFGFVLRDSRHCLLERMSFHDIRGTGLNITGTSDDNLVLDCDAYDNRDPETAGYAYGNANGFTSTTTAGTTNTFRRCRAWQNSDDGFDHFSERQGQGVVVHDQCWAFRNGYLPDGVTPAGDGDGFKFGKAAAATGGVTRIATRCLAFDNRLWGFDQNGLPDPIRLLNCTAHANGQGINLNQLSKPHEVRNSVTFGTVSTNWYDDVAIYNNPNVTHDHNSWDTTGLSVTAADFLSIDWTAMDGPRGADGSLPVLDYLRLAQGSDLVDAGADVGLEWTGAAPDLGCFER